MSGPSHDSMGVSPHSEGSGGDHVETSLSPTSHAPSTNGHGTPHGHSHGHSLNARSCVTCRKRKVKCDKKHPCTNCAKAHIECIFPAPGRAPRKSRKPPDSELLARLRRLEGMVQTLSHAPEDASDVSQSQATRPSIEDAEYIRPLSDRSMSADWDHLRESTDNKFGRLVIEDGRSRYVNSSHWANLSNEVEDLKGILNEVSSDEDEQHHSPGSTPTANHSGFMFGHSSLALDLSALRPPKEHLSKYMDDYVNHVDPLVKVLHIPSTRKLIESYYNSGAKPPKGLEALMFAIFYAGVTSLDEADCKQRGWEAKSDLLARYRFAVEQSLARANFLITDELIVVQALTLFVMCLRRNDDARTTWALTGLLMRLVTTLGLHRDPTHFNLDPLETEIRRRTFWQAVLLDIRSAEDQGCEAFNMEQGYDTKMPTNCDDADITPGMKEPVVAKEGCTEMTFSLIRFEIAKTVRRVLHAPAPFNTDSGPIWTETSLEEKEHYIEDCHSRVEETYLKHCDMNIPIHWVTATVARLMMAKMWLITYHPFQRLDGGSSLPPETRDRLFITSLESIEFGLLLETEVRTVKWGWLFKSFVQWHALAFLLSELCVRTKGSSVVRAWRSIDALLVGWGALAGGDRRSQIWRPLRKLMAKARAQRDLAVQSDISGLLDTNKPDMLARASATPRTHSEIIAMNVAQYVGSVNPNVAPRTKPSEPLEYLPLSRTASTQDTFMDLAVSENMQPSQFFAAQPQPTPLQLDQCFRWQASPDTWPTGDLSMGELGTVQPEVTQATDLETSMGLNDPNLSMPVMGAGLAENTMIDATLFPPANPGGDASTAITFGSQNDPNLTNPSGLTDTFTNLPENANLIPANAGVSEPEMRWSDWDDMVREFQNEHGQGGPGWNRRPVLGESWL